MEQQKFIESDKTFVCVSTSEVSKWNILFVLSSQSKGKRLLDFSTKDQVTVALVGMFRFKYCNSIPF